MIVTIKTIEKFHFLVVLGALLLCSGCGSDIIGDPEPQEILTAAFQVTDQTGTPIEGATVSGNGYFAQENQLTNANGEANLGVGVDDYPRDYTIQVSKAGYQVYGTSLVVSLSTQDPILMPVQLTVQ